MNNFDAQNDKYFQLLVKQMLFHEKANMYFLMDFHKGIVDSTIEALKLYQKMMELDEEKLYLKKLQKLSEKYEILMVESRIKDENIDFNEGRYMGFIGAIELYREMEIENE